MNIECYGTITLNKPLTKKAIDAIKKRFKSDHYSDFVSFFDGEISEIEIDELHDSEIESTLQSLCDVLVPLGYTLKGKIRYFGDYDGYVYLEETRAHMVDEEDVALYEATDETLIEMLTARGYKVTKPKSRAKK